MADRGGNASDVVHRVELGLSKDSTVRARGWEHVKLVGGAHARGVVVGGKVV